MMPGGSRDDEGIVQGFRVQGLGSETTKPSVQLEAVLNLFEPRSLRFLLGPCRCLHSLMPQATIRQHVRDMYAEVRADMRGQPWLKLKPEPNISQPSDTILFTRKQLERLQAGLSSPHVEEDRCQDRPTSHL